MFTSAVQFAATIAAPALSRALNDLADHARAGADIMEELAGKVRRAGAAPIPACVTVSVPAGKTLTLEDLVRLAAAAGRVVYAP